MSSPSSTFQAFALVLITLGVIASAAAQEPLIVDQQPLLVPGSCRYVYPDSLRESWIEGRVRLEAIIDREGRPEPHSVRVLTSTNPAFESPARAGFITCRFEPGRVRGRPVRTRVEIPINFHPAGQTPEESATTVRITDLLPRGASVLDTTAVLRATIAYRIAEFDSSSQYELVVGFRISGGELPPVGCQPIVLVVAEGSASFNCNLADVLRHGNLLSPLQLTFSLHRGLRTQHPDTLRRFVVTRVSGLARSPTVMFQRP